MMNLSDLSLALWLGVLTSISPCPLATNIAAISYLGKNAGNKRITLWSGLAYTTGRMTTYLVLGAVLVSFTRIIPRVSLFLQQHMPVILGPVLIIVGLFLLEVFRFSLGGQIINQDAQERLSRSGLWGAFLLGLLFALSFCPVSAALFFGNTITLAMKHQSRLLFPGVYGFGTALPVILFSFLIAFGIHAVGKAYNKLSKFEKWARRSSGVVFICAGIYYTITHFFY